jgi:hypothetical protein
MSLPSLSLLLGGAVWPGTVHAAAGPFLCVEKVVVGGAPGDNGGSNNHRSGQHRGDSHRSGNDSQPGHEARAGGYEAFVKKSPISAA